MFDYRRVFWCPGSTFHQGFSGFQAEVHGYIGCDPICGQIWVSLRWTNLRRAGVPCRDWQIPGVREGWVVLCSQLDQSDLVKDKGHQQFQQWTAPDHDMMGDQSSPFWDGFLYGTQGKPDVHSFCWHPMGPHSPQPQLPVVSPSPEMSLVGKAIMAVGMSKVFRTNVELRGHTNFDQFFRRPASRIPESLPTPKFKSQTAPRAPSCRSPISHVGLEHAERFSNVLKWLSHIPISTHYILFSTPEIGWFGTSGASSWGRAFWKGPQQLRRRPPKRAKK